MAVSQRFNWAHQWIAAQLDACPRISIPLLHAYKVIARVKHGIVRWKKRTECSMRKSFG